MPPMVARLAVEISGREAQAERRQLRVQFVQHDARLHAHPALLRVHFEHAVVVFRDVDLDAVADRLPACEVPPPRMVIGQRKRRQISSARRMSSRCLGDHHAERLDLVDAGVGGIERAGDRVEADFAFDASFPVRAAKRMHRPPSRSLVERDSLFLAVRGSLDSQASFILPDARGYFVFRLGTGIRELRRILDTLYPNRAKRGPNGVSDALLPAFPHRQKLIRRYRSERLLRS